MTAVNCEHQQSEAGLAVSAAPPRLRGPLQSADSGRRQRAGSAGIHPQQAFHHFDSSIKTCVNY